MIIMYFRTVKSSDSTFAVSMSMIRG